MAGNNKEVETSHQDTPLDAQSQRSAHQGFEWHLTLEQACSFPEKSRAMKDGTSTTLTRLQLRRTSMPMVKPVQDSAQEPNSGARVIITQVLCNKTARGHAGTEASSRSAHHAPIDPYSITYAM